MWTSWTWDADGQKKKGKGKAVLLYTFGQEHSCGIFPHSANAIDVQQPT